MVKFWFSTSVGTLNRFDLSDSELDNNVFQLLQPI